MTDVAGTAASDPNPKEEPRSRMIGENDKTGKEQVECTGFGIQTSDAAKSIAGPTTKLELLQADRQFGKNQ